MTKFITILILLAFAWQAYAADRYQFGSNTNNVTDTSTGLMWLRDASVCGSLDWTNAISYCSGLTTNGFSDWRLPTLGELSSIFYTGGSYDGTNGTPFVNVQAANPYWSSTEYPVEPLAQASARFMEGSGGIVLDKIGSIPIWPVRTRLYTYIVFSGTSVSNMGGTGMSVIRGRTVVQE